MKKGIFVFFGIFLFLGTGTSHAEKNRIQSALQEAHVASCSDALESARRPMCLNEAELRTHLVAAGGDEELMDRNLSGEGRLRIKPTRYGTIRRISGPSLSAEKFEKDSDPVEFVRQYLTRNSESFGVVCPQESLLLPKVFDLKYGGKVVKLKQYYGYRYPYIMVRL